MQYHVHSHVNSAAQAINVLQVVVDSSVYLPLRNFHLQRSHLKPYQPPKHQLVVRQKVAALQAVFGVTGEKHFHVVIHAEIVERIKNHELVYRLPTDVNAGIVEDLVKNSIFSGPATISERCALEPCSFPRTDCCFGSVMSYNGRFICGPMPAPTQGSTCFPNCCPNNGVWSAWSDPGPCPTSCGSCTTLTMTRECLSQAQGCPCR